MFWTRSFFPPTYLPTYLPTCSHADVAAFSERSDDESGAVVAQVFEGVGAAVVTDLHLKVLLCLMMMMMTTMTMEEGFGQQGDDETDLLH